MKSLTAILAISDDGIIGVDGPSGPTLPWRLPPDLRRFKELTSGHAIIMGRKTFVSLGSRCLPKRKNIVMTRGRVPLSWTEQPGGESPVIAMSPIAALQHAWEHDESPFVIGGAQVFDELWSRVTRVELTEVHVNIGHVVAGGCWFNMPRIGFTEIARTAGEHDGLRYDFVTLERAS